MVSLYTSLHLLKLKQYEFHHTSDVDCIKTSNRYSCSQGQYTEEKNEYYLSQCSKSENQSRLLKNIQHVDKFFRSYKCLHMSWNLNQPLILFFSNGAIVSLELNSENNTLLKMEIDETLCGKFLPTRIVDVIFCKNYIYVSYVEPKLTIIQINQDSPNLIAKVLGKKKGKFVGFDPKFFNFDLCVHSPKPAERKLSLNKEKNLLLIWWKNSGDDVWPWMPITYLTDRLNLFVYSVNGLDFELLYPVKVQNELLYAAFSKEFSYKFFCLEESKQDDNFVTNISIYEIKEGHCQIVNSTKLPVSGRLVAFDWSFTEDKLLASDSNGCLIFYDGKPHCSTVDAFNSRYLPLHIAWHPQACIALIVCRNNLIFCMDIAFNLIDFKLCYKNSSQSNIDINSFFSSKLTVQKVMWQKSYYNDSCLLYLDPEKSSFLIIKISLGYISRFNISYLELINQYLKCGEFDRAKLVYLRLEWEFHADLKFQCLSKIINYLLRKPLDIVVQYNLENMLGSFYLCIDNIPRKVVKYYEPKMYHLSRRFFHFLVRYNKFEKAWSLAVDLDSQDLFLDLYQIALQQNQNILAAVALRKAEMYDSLVTDSSSQSCESGTCSESGSSCDIEYKDKRSEKHSAYRKMFQDILHRISDSCEDVESDSQQTNEINKAFENFKLHKNQMLCDTPCSSSFKEVGFASVNVPDTYQQLHNPTYSTRTQKGRSQSKRSLVDMPPNKCFEGSCFSRHLKYATTPISNKDYNNMLHNKSTQVPFCEIGKQNNLPVFSSTEEIKKDCFEEKSSEAVSSTSATGVDTENYFASKRVTKDSSAFSPVLMQSSPKTTVHCKYSQSSCSNNDSITHENLMYVNSNHFISLPTQKYEAETVSDLPSRHLCDNYSGNEYSPLSTAKESSKLLTTTSEIVSACNSECLNIEASSSNVIHDRNKSPLLHSSLKNSKTCISKEYFNFSSAPQAIEDRSSTTAKQCKISSPFKNSTLSKIVYRTVSDSNFENTVPVPHFCKDMSYGSSQIGRSFYDAKCDNANQSNRHNILTKSKSCLDNSCVSQVASSNLQGIESSCASLRNTLDQSYKIFSSLSTSTNDTKYLNTFHHNRQNISIKPSEFILPSSIESGGNFDLHHSSSLICDKQISFKGKDCESYVAEEESEEMEGTKIKLDHLGII